MSLLSHRKFGLTAICLLFSAFALGETTTHSFYNYAPLPSGRPDSETIDIENERVVTSLQIHQTTYSWFSELTFRTEDGILHMLRVDNLAAAEKIDPLFGEFARSPHSLTLTCRPNSIESLNSLRIYRVSGRRPNASTPTPAAGKCWIGSIGHRN